MHLRALKRQNQKPKTEPLIPGMVDKKALMKWRMKEQYIKSTKELVL